MQTSVAGNNVSHASRATGFTLLELLVVLVIMAIASAGVVMSLRDSSQSALEREAQRLVALLEAGRAQSRAIGVPVRWKADSSGFLFTGASANTEPTPWLGSVAITPNPALFLLGPEPMIAPQSVTLSSPANPKLAWRIYTDGLAPFQIQAEAR